MVADTYIIEEVNPHQEKEWEMMQKGTKPVALFALHQEALPAEFQSAHGFIEETLEISIDSPRGSKQNRRRGAKKLTFKIFSQPSKIQEALRLKEILLTCYNPQNGRITAEREAEMGRILGYSEQEITAYQAWIEQFKISLYLPATMPEWPNKT